MKKRALSIVLALALCFTMFSAMGSAAALNVDRAKTAIGNLLDNVAQDADAPEGQATRISVIKDVAGNVPAVSLSDQVWSALADAILKDTAVDDTASAADGEAPQKYIYYMLRYIQEKVDTADYPDVAALVKALESADAEYSTAGKGINESLSLFDSYQDALAELVKESVSEADVLKELNDLGFIVYNEEIATSLKDAIKKEIEASGNKAAIAEGLYDKGYVSEAYISSEKVDAVYAAVETKCEALTADQKEELAKKLEADGYITIDENNYDSVTAADIVAAVKANLTLSEAVAYLADYVDVKTIILDTVSVDDVDIDAVATAMGGYSELADFLKAYGINAEEEVVSSINFKDGANKGNVVAYAKEKVMEAAQYVSNLVFATSGAEFNEAYDSFLGDDIAKKNAALAFGKDLLSQITGMRTVILDYAANNKTWFHNEIINAYISSAFSADSATAVNALHEAAGKLVEKVAKNEDGNADVQALIDALAADLGITMDEGYKAFSDAINALDSESKFQAVWYDLALSRVLNVYSDSALSAEADTLANEGIFTLGIYREGLKTRFGIENAIPVTDKVLVTTDTEGVSVEYIDGAAYWQIKYDDKAVSEGDTANLHVYRGADALNGDEALRYIGTYCVKLVPAGEEPPVENSLTINDLSNATYVPGDIVYIGGKVVGSDFVAIAVTNPAGEATTIENVAAATYNGEGQAYEIPEDAAVGKYTVVASDENGNTAETYFIVDTVKREVVITEPVEGTVVAPGETITIKGTSEGLPALIVSVKNPDGTLYFEATVTPEQFVEGIALTIDEAAVKGDKYSIIVGSDVDVNGQTITVADETYVVVDIAEVSDVLTIEEEINPSELSVSSGTTWKTLVKKLATTVTLTNEDGTVSTEAEITWNEDSYASNFKIDNKAVSTQTVVGTYEVPEGYTAVDTGKDNAIDGVVETKVNKKTGGGGGGSTGTSTHTGDTTDTSKVTMDIFNIKDHYAYMIGYEDGTVRPEANVSREEVTTILFRLLTEESVEKYNKNSTNAFSDIESDRWSMGFIATLDNIGIIKGYEDGSFRPGQAITRAEFAALISRLAQVDPASTTGEDSYSDISDHWAKSHIEIATAEGWFVGDDTGKFRPDDTITRAEAATVINRMLERSNVNEDSFKGLDINKFSDLSEDAWYYVQMVEATTTHDFEKSVGYETWTKTSYVDSEYFEEEPAEDVEE